MNPNEQASGIGGIGRLIWMAFGPMLLAITTMYIFSNGTGWHTVADYVFFAVLLLMILGRWLEFRGGVPLTSTGEAATRRDLHLYVAGVLIAGFMIWILANAFGNHGMTA